MNMLRQIEIEKEIGARYEGMFLTKAQIMKLMNTTNKAMVADFLIDLPSYGFSRRPRYRVSDVAKKFLELEER